MQARNLWRYLGAGLTGTVAVAAFAGLATSSPRQDSDHLAAFLVFPGFVFALTGLALLTDAVAAWLISVPLTAGLVYVAVNITPVQASSLGMEPITYLIDLVAGGMVLVLTARAIEPFGQPSRPIGDVLADPPGP